MTQTRRLQAIAYTGGNIKQLSILNNMLEVLARSADLSVNIAQKFQIEEYDNN